MRFIELLFIFIVVDIYSDNICLLNIKRTDVKNLKLFKFHVDNDIKLNDNQ